MKHPKGQDRDAVVYPVKVTDDGTIHVGFDKFSDRYFTDEDFWCIMWGHYMYEGQVGKKTDEGGPENILYSAVYMSMCIYMDKWCFS